ncbi:Sugar phosphate transporter domain [Trinorchestia longiramus]|nr:Sugar phosphate transporter domain [Trinorchestia longiramus]
MVRGKLLTCSVNMGEPGTKSSLMHQYVKIFLVVALYWVVSISMVFLNKSILGTAKGGKDDAPLFVTWFQCVITVAICFVLSRSSVLLPGVVTFPRVGVLDSNVVKKVLPLSIMFVCMITFNNLCLKYVGVAFYYVGRSLSTVFNVFFSYLILGQHTPVAAISCCGVIIGGFLLGVNQEGQAGSLSIIGVVFGVLAAASVSLNSIFTKKALPAVDGSIWQLSYYNNVIASVIFLPVVVLSGELSAIYVLLTSSSLTYWILLGSTGVCGFAIGYVTGLQIQVTSPLTHTISGTAKACAQTVLATTWYNEHKPSLWWLSNAVVLLGSLAYTRVMQLVMKKEHQKEQARDELPSGTLVQK